MGGLGCSIFIVTNLPTIMGYNYVCKYYVCNNNVCNNYVCMIMYVIMYK